MLQFLCAVFALQQKKITLPGPIAEKKNVSPNVSPNNEQTIQAPSTALKRHDEDDIIILIYLYHLATNLINKMQAMYDEFLREIENFRTMVKNVSPDNAYKYGLDDSDFRDAVREHVLETIQNGRVDGCRYWGLQEIPGKEKSDLEEYLSKSFFNLGYIILQGHKIVRGKQNAKILKYLQDTQKLRYTF